MARIPLKVQGVTDITASDSASLLIITDKEETRQITIICDASMRHEFGIRRGKYVGEAKQRALATEHLQFTLPETLASLIKYMTDLELAVIILNVFDGQYRAIIEDQKTGTAIPIRVSDGVLLTYADPHIPLYIEESLWRHQSVPYLGEDARGVAMPLNTLSVEMLRTAMERCIADEKYELAQQLKEEIERRKI